MFCQFGHRFLVVHPENTDVGVTTAGLPETSPQEQNSLRQLGHIQPNLSNSSDKEPQLSTQVREETLKVADNRGEGGQL
jgi:hypothetical protein